MRFKFKALTGAALAVGLTFGAAAAIASPAGAATTGPTAKATPNTGLQNAQTVTLTGKGFTPSVALDILQCNHTVKTTMAAACSISNIAHATPSSTGVLPATPFTVATGAIGNGHCLTSTGAPTANNTCYIILANPGNTADAALATIHFANGPFAKATPSTKLVNAQVISVNGGGFTAGATVAMVECNHTVLTTGQAACNITSPVLATISKTGAVPATHFTVATGTVGTGTGAGSCVTSTTPTADNTCYVAVANIANTAQAAVAKIVFQN